MRFILSFMFILITFHRQTFAMYAAHEIKKVPIQRLISNLEKVPKTAEQGYIHAQYELARLYAMTYALKKDESDQVDAFKQIFDRHAKQKDGIYTADFGHEPKVVPFETIKTKMQNQNKTAQHFLNKAITQYQSVLNISGVQRHEEATLGLGWCYLEAGQNEEAKKYLRKAISLFYEHETEAIMGPSGAAEAIEYLTKLLSPQNDKAELADLSLKRQRIQSAARLVTPLILPMSKQQTSFEDLTIRAKVVNFDLDGSGHQKKWKWINPRAGWLVYKKDDKISSALEMFGNVTFWIFWPNGYEALRALDDNQDGIIRNQELENIYVWNDKNENGMTDPTEILSMEELHIVGLNVKYKTQKNGILTSPNGVLYSDGSTLPTYDFISEEIK